MKTIPGKQTAIEFTNGDAENLYTSCMEVQKLDWGLNQEIQLAKLISKLRHWLAPITEIKEKKIKALGFLQSDGKYSPMSKFSQEEREQKIIDLNEQFACVNKEKFEYTDELLNMLPLSLFTESKIGDGKFTGCDKRQYFIEFCVKCNDS